MVCYHVLLFPFEFEINSIMYRNVFRHFRSLVYHFFIRNLLKITVYILVI